MFLKTGSKNVEKGDNKKLEKERVDYDRLWYRSRTLSRDM